MMAYQKIEVKLHVASKARAEAERMIPELAEAIRSLKTANVNPNAGVISSNRLFHNVSWSARANLIDLASDAGNENRQYELVARAVEMSTTPEHALEVVKKAVERRKTDFGDSASVVRISEKASLNLAIITGMGWLQKPGRRTPPGKKGTVPKGATQQDCVHCPENHGNR